MTSMIDVVFLLLIFFMVTASFVKTERHLNPAIKSKDKSSQRPQTPQDRAEVSIERGASGKFVYKLGGVEYPSVKKLTETLKTAYSASQKTEEGAIVYVDDEAPFGMAAGAIQACKSAGFLGVSYVPGSKN